MRGKKEYSKAFGTKCVGQKHEPPGPHGEMSLECLKESGGAVSEGRIKAAKCGSRSLCIGSGGRCHVS
jgi:hypothetical protein